MAISTSDAPADVARPEDTRGDPHRRRLARLEYEDATRREMNGALRKLEAGREKLEDVIKTKRDNLASLRPQLQKILEASKPTQVPIRFDFYLDPCLH